MHIHDLGAVMGLGCSLLVLLLLCWVLLGWGCIVVLQGLRKGRPCAGLRLCTRVCLRLLCAGGL